MNHTIKIRKMEKNKQNNKRHRESSTSTESSSLNLSDVIDAVRSVDPVYQAIALAGPSTSGTRPEVRILEQPRETRFRYVVEERSAGTILGERSTNSHKTYPTIQIYNYSGPFRIVVSCVSKDPDIVHNQLKYRTHPHELVDGNVHCHNGVYHRVFEDNNSTIKFEGLGISCVKRNDIKEALEKRESLKVDPFLCGFSHKNEKQSVNLNALRLCFQVFLPKALPPLVSSIVYNNRLVIKRCTPCSGPVSRETEIVLLCEKVSLEEHDVVFYEPGHKDAAQWEVAVRVMKVHRQCAAVLLAPSYRFPDSDQHHTVYIALRRRETGACSEPVPFEYTPKYTDPTYIAGIRKKPLFDYAKYAQAYPVPANLLRSQSATDSESTLADSMTECATPMSGTQDVWSPGSTHDPFAPGSSHDQFAAGTSLDPYTPGTSHDYFATDGIGLSMWGDVTTPSPYLETGLDSSMDAMFTPVPAFLSTNNILPYTSDNRLANIQVQEQNIPLVVSEENSLSEIMNEIYLKTSSSNFHMDDNDKF